MLSPVVEVKNIWKSYEVKKFGFKKTFFYALIDISLAIFKGETVGLSLIHI